ncbi:hypothetical protein [Vibrio sp. Evd11]|uniref:hypothetical protein n=1 Tax=Vibrio sp. Evd11 TaxID=1207404 RepID=UPI0013C452DF|nr:hypothetical protein [Vibrio sp. Evd11]
MKSIEDKSMHVAKPNFAVTIHFTVGIKKSVAITLVEERWLNSIEVCDVFENDLIDEGATAVLECVGVDLDVCGSFIVEVLGVAKHEDSPDYEIIKIKLVTKGDIEVLTEKNKRLFDALNYVYESGYLRNEVDQKARWGLGLEVENETTIAALQPRI